MNRRSFISSLAVAGAAATLPSRIMASDTKPRQRIGLIGCGWFGGVNLGNFVRFAGADLEIVSLCDPNAKALARTQEGVVKAQQRPARTFADYREMLASGKHDIVIVATPDHWHALPAIAAMQAGADLFLEKPIGVDVIEGEALVAAARKHQRVVQVNLHRRSNRISSEARDKYIRSGKLGPVGVVETFCYLPMRPAETTDPLKESPVPSHLDYEWWTGPAPKRAFCPALESIGWRSFMEYGNGIIGDMGVHILDQVRWMLGLGWPESISSSGGVYVDRNTAANISDTQQSLFRFPNLDVRWEHRTWGRSPIPDRHWTDQWGARFFGKNGTLKVTMAEYEFTPVGGGPREGLHLCSTSGDLENVDFAKFDSMAGETNQRHISDFLAARETRAHPIADVGEAHISTACCVIANLAQELRRPIAYDPQTRTVPSDAEATRGLVRAYRAPWQHPDPERV